MLPLDLKAIAGERLTGGDAAQVEREVGDARHAAGLHMEMRDLEQPAVRLVAGVFSGDAVQPALDAAGQPEIGRVDGEDERAVDDAVVEPLR